jgi:suppressor of fused-like protein
MGLLRRLLGDRPPDPARPGAARSKEAAHHAPGWVAIDAALVRRYGEQVPRRWGAMLRRRLGGSDPLDGISAYHDEGPPSHWHYVTYGLSELYAKQSADPARSGWGIELTFRLRRADGDSDAPEWPITILQNLARYVFESRNRLLPGHHIDARGPIALDEPTELVATAFAADPDLPGIQTPNGSVDFVQLFGLTRDEYDAARAWDTSALLDLVRRANPLLVTDLGRETVLADPELAAEVARRTADEGTSQDGIFVEDLSWSLDAGLEIIVGASAVPDVALMLAGRVGLGKIAAIYGRNGRILLRPGDGSSWTVEGDALALTLPADAARALAGQIAVRAGDYRVAEVPELRLHVVPSVIRDEQGNEVERIG